jgi:hypothetical protein
MSPTSFAYCSSRVCNFNENAFEPVSGMAEPDELPTALSQVMFILQWGRAFEPVTAAVSEPECLLLYPAMFVISIKLT